MHTERTVSSSDEPLRGASLPAATLELDPISEQVAARLAALARETMRGFGAPSVLGKWDGSVVTETDLLVNTELRPFLEKLVPGSFYLGEESADATFGDYGSVLAHEYLWAVDEIDGTQNFAAGAPIFGTSIGLLRREGAEHRLVMGCVSFPALDEIYFQRGESVILRRISDGSEAPIVPSHRALDGRSFVCLPDNFFDNRRFDTSDCPAVPRVLGCVIADIIYTARGVSAGTITDFHLWDFAGSLALAQKLGVEMRSCETGERKLSFSAKDFVPGVRRKNWCLAEQYVVSTAENFEGIASLVSDRARA